MKKALTFVGAVTGSTMISLVIFNLVGRLLTTIMAAVILLGTTAAYVKKTYDDWFLHPPYHQRYRDLE